MVTSDDLPVVSKEIKYPPSHPHSALATKGKKSLPNTEQSVVSNVVVVVVVAVVVIRHCYAVIIVVVSLLW